ncbi:MAG: rod shape-determining protein MreC [Bdellovibrionales bacterium]
MKRRSLLRSQKPFGVQAIASILPENGATSFILIAFSFLIFLFSVVSPQSVSGIRMSVSDSIAPVLGAVTKPIVHVSDVVRDASGLGDLQAENIRLRQENLRLKDWYQTALLLEAENKSLRDLLNVKTEPHYKTITARVLADNGNTFARSILISAGANDGVEKGQAVMSGDGLIGRIVETGKTSSRILLVTDINSRVPVLVEDTRQHAILAGDNNNKANLIHLPPDSSVKDGSRIITSGHGGVFPHGLPIGKINKSETGAMEVLPFVEFDRIVHVRVLDKTADPNLLPAGSNKSLSVLQ